MNNLRDRLTSHANKLRKQEEMDAALAGVFNQESQAARERFVALVNEVIKPAFHVFKTTLRELGRDAAIVVNLEGSPQQAIILTLMDRYLSFGAGKTLKLVNPKDDIAKQPNAKFYEIFCASGALGVRQKVVADLSPIVTQVTYPDITSAFLENELANFFERAYPTSL